MQYTVNKAGNGAGSVTVALPDLRRSLLVKRNATGAETPAGQRCSNLDEMLQNRETATGQQLGNLNYWIGRQLDDLARLAPSGSKGDRQ